MLHNTKPETIYPATTLESLNPQHALQTDNTREASITSERLDDADYKIFSDGSGHNNGIGTSAILYEKGRACPLKSLQFFMGNSDKHNTYEAEIAGTILALWLLNNTLATVGKRVSLYTDNQSLVTMLPHPKATPGQYLLGSLCSTINRTGCRFTIKWISGYSKVKGNKEADRLAKDTAEGRSSPRASLPHVLRNPLPSSASALKQEFIHKLRAKWATMWEILPRKPRITQFEDVFPFNVFLKRLNLLTQKQASTILQIQCGHFPLNTYLHKINKVDSSRCPACDKDQEGLSSPETINHFVFDCMAHLVAREELTGKIGMINFNLSDIMADTDHMKALTTFINRTQRFRA